MNFFEHQDKAKGQTAWLLALLACAVLVIVGVFEAGLWIAFDGKFNDSGFWLASTGILVFFTLVIGGGSLVRTVQLSFGGGKSVAESLGGKLLHPGDNLDPASRRILNIVEEMSLAAGMSVPPVYLIEESGINAFAAGYSPSDAVIGITRGCIENLNRDELQGVVAHEFSHICNGDMRLNIRLMGLIFGLVVMSLLGELLVRLLGNVSSSSRSSRSSVSGSSNSKDNSGGILLALFLIGVGLWLLGFLGSLFARIIQAAISRQREFLADASAVQYTRNPSGISGALKKIGGIETHGMIHSPEAVDANHMFFACGVKASGLFSLDSHPPLAERIRRIEPNWDGKYIQSLAETNGEIEGEEAVKHHEMLSGLVGQGSNTVGNTVQSPPSAGALRPLDSALDAVGLAYVLAGDTGESIAGVSPWACEAPEWSDLEKAMRMAYLAPWIRQLSPGQKATMLERLNGLPLPMDLFTACFRQVISLWLMTPRQKQAMGRGASRIQAAIGILGAVANASGMSGSSLEEGWQKAIQTLAQASPKVPLPQELPLVPSKEAIGVIASAPERLRRRLLDACGVLIRQDQTWTESERVLMVCLAGAFDIPAPPEALSA